MARNTMRTCLLFLFACSFCDLIGADFNESCHYPGSPQHGQLSQWVQDFPDASIATFECSPGYERVGPGSLTCINGTWDRGVPFCVRDLAREKPVRQAKPLKMDFNTKFLVDGNDSSCTEPANHWSVNLLEKTRITSVKLVLGADVVGKTVSIKVGNEPLDSNGTSTGALCAKLDVALKKNTTYYVRCNEELSFGSYISIHIEPEKNPVPLCALEAHSSSGVSHEDACPPGYNDTFKDAFNGVCYEFHYIDPAPIGDARSICYKNDGRLLAGADADELTLNYLKWRIEKDFRKSSFWLDLNSTEAETLMNNTDRINDPGKGNCVVLSSKSGFGRSECESPNHVICAYSVVSCGRPRLPKALDGWQVIDKLRTGRSLKNLKCAEGFYAEMDGTLSCDSRGEMGGAIRCQEFVCGKPPVVDEGFSSATSNLTVEYKCAGSKFVKGNARAVCDSSTLKWSGGPTCQTFLAAIGDSLRTMIVGIQTFRQFSFVSQVGIVAAMAAAVVLVLLGIVHRVRSVRRRKGTKARSVARTT